LLAGVGIAKVFESILPPIRTYDQDDHYNRIVWVLIAWIIWKVGMILIKC
jgi:hypothetical protein